MPLAAWHSILDAAEHDRAELTAIQLGEAIPRIHAVDAADRAALRGILRDWAPSPVVAKAIRSTRDLMIAEELT